MNDVSVLVGVAVALLLGAMSPGASFLVTAQTALARSRRDGLLVALGLGVGGLLFALLALGGLIAVLTAVEPIYVALKVAGALYILWIAIAMWRGSRTPLPTAGQNTDGAPFLRGLTVQVSNPKTAIVYASVFASLVPSDPQPWLYVALPVAVFVVEAGWYSVVASGMSTGRLRAGYGRAKTWVDRSASLVVGALGLRLLTTASSRGL